jgi:hypothetical protein
MAGAGLPGLTFAAGGPVGWMRRKRIVAAADLRKGEAVCSWLSVMQKARPPSR